MYFQQTEHNKFMKYLPMLLLQQLSYGLSYYIEYGYFINPILFSFQLEICPDTRISSI